MADDKVQAELLKGTVGAGEGQSVEGIKMGTIVILVCSSGTYTGFVQEKGILNLPFFVKDHTHCFYEVHKYALDIHQALIVSPCVISDRRFESYPKIKKAVFQAGREFQFIQRKHDEAYKKICRQKWADYGIKAYVPDDPVRFMKAARSISPQSYELLGKEGIEMVIKISQGVLGPVLP